MEKVVEYSGPLRSVIEKGTFEDKRIVCGDELLLHVAKVHEEKAVNEATAMVPLLDREYERWVHRMARVVTRINGHVFPSVQEAYSFFRSLTQPHMEEFVKAYSTMIEESKNKLGVMVQEVKN